MDSLENGSDESSIGNSFSKRDIIELSGTQIKVMASDISKWRGTQKTTIILMKQLCWEIGEKCFSEVLKNAPIGN